MVEIVNIGARRELISSPALIDSFVNGVNRNGYPPTDTFNSLLTASRISMRKKEFRAKFRDQGIILPQSGYYEQREKGPEAAVEEAYGIVLRSAKRENDLQPFSYTITPRLLKAADTTPQALFEEFLFAQSIPAGIDIEKVTDVAQADAPGKGKARGSTYIKTGFQISPSGDISPYFYIPKEGLGEWPPDQIAKRAGALLYYFKINADESYRKNRVVNENEPTKARTVLTR